MELPNPTMLPTSQNIDKLFQLNLDQSDILDRFSKSHDTLAKTMNDDRLSDDSLSLLMHLLAKSVSCSYIYKRQDVLQILQTFSESSIVKTRMHRLLVGVTFTNVNTHNFPCLLTDVLYLLQQLYLRMPSLCISTHIIGLADFLKAQISECDHEGKQSLLDDADRLKNEILLAFEDHTKSMSKDPEDKLIPPSDFRKIPIVPTDDDVYYNSEFLRKNKKLGTYKDLDHYLDVQYRLYREDCISPLRDALQEYLQKQKEMNRFRLENGIIYREVKIIGKKTSLDSGEVFEVKLDPEHCKKIKWMKSKRLLYGSLLLLSFDRYKTVFFAVVAESERETLQKNGCFLAQVFRSVGNTKLPWNTPGIILEATSAYFEAYKHVLKALKNINEETFQFQRYLVYCEKEIKAPTYIDTDTKYDLRPVIRKCRIELTETLIRGNLRQRQQQYKDTHDVQLFSEDEWPSNVELHMDESQRQAFISALTREFVLIQGPPGTGKTYLGLQIARALLHNCRKWENFDMEAGKPYMLVVCYTNHALDQFVEGIIDFLPQTSRRRVDYPDVVRFGRRCTNPKVEEFSIQNVKRKVKRDFYYHNRNPRGDVLDEAMTVKQEIQDIRHLLKVIQNKNVVLNLYVMKEVMLEHHLKNFGNGENFIWFQWLHVLEQSWFKEVNKQYQSMETESDVQIQPHTTNESEQEETITVETEADHAINERYLDVDDTQTNLDLRHFGLDVDVQLQIMLEKGTTLEEKCQAILLIEKQKIEKELHRGETMLEETATKVRNVWKLELADRWKLYRYWLNKYIGVLKGKLQTKEQQYNDVFDDYQRASKELDEHIMNQATVIAMTTTNAARYSESLNKVGPMITIIEEAAEVPEAHIVTAINPRCRHVILIGDHKQLEPKPADHELAMKYNLSVSLFERMLINKLDYHCLRRQHRMRPEISSLVRHIYDNVLEDNENVLEYKAIGGVRKSLYFITHGVKEKFNEDGRSYSNNFEAEYLKELCHYLIKQGYKPDEITIIAAYTGQMYCIREKMPKSQFQGVNICVLDNYQGEENEIILLSLVRSNENGDIGFLNRENRICVALSRAKQGLYIIGNSKTLTKKSNHWRTIVQKLKHPDATNTSDDETYTDKAIGTALELYCQNHPRNDGILAKTPDDFKKSPDGGCALKCEFRLDCGHACRKRCHPVDKEHKLYKCKSTCLNECQEGHVCKRSCHFPKDCECRVPMKRELPCNHTKCLECHVNYREYLCQERVTRTLHCEHQAVMRCYEDPTRYLCKTIVERLFPCGHSAMLKCHVNPDTHKCTEVITDTRTKCGHEFRRQCHDKTFERLNKCEITISEKRSRCGHEFERQCYDTMYEYLHGCKEIVTVKRSNCDHIYSRKCHDKIYELKNKCKEKVQDSWPSCDHLFERLCHDTNYTSVNTCDVIVEDTWSGCGHQYVRQCWDRNYESRMKCEAKVIKSFPSCGHEMTLSCHTDILSVKCKQVIETRFDCGHTLNHFCYRADTVVCKSQCGKICENNHTCRKDCHFPNPCYCKVLVEKVLEKCMHRQVVPCSTLENKFNCIEVVTKTLPLCGHEHKMKCHVDPVSIRCTTKVLKSFPGCEHKKSVPCFSDLTGEKCTTMIDKVLDKCGHKSKIKCWEKDREDVKCQSTVQYRRPDCKHVSKIECWMMESDETIPPCRTNVDKIMQCGHILKFECHAKGKDRPCKKKCSSLLPCGHRCTRECNICQTSGEHGECTQKCDKELLCGHRCESKICSNCVPCRQTCTFACDHFKCSRKCIDPCEPCTEKCRWKCRHFECTKLCNEICDRPRCDKLCDKNLRCGHPCTGYCGEPCPDNCFKCKPKMYHFSSENEKKQITVTLKLCGHSFAFTFLDDYMTLTENDLLSKCPLCRSIVHTHPRYNEILTRRKCFIEDIKHKMRSTMISSETLFPTPNANYKKEIDGYTRGFATYLQISSHVSNDDEFLTLVETAEHLVVDNIDQIKNQAGDNLKTWLTISRRTLKMYIQWIACLLFSQQGVLKKQFTVPNIDIIGAHPSSKLTGEELLHTLCTADETIKIKDLQNMVQLLVDEMEDNAYLKKAKWYPQNMHLLGVHSEDWTLCAKGHPRSNLIEGLCYTCDGGEQHDYSDTNAVQLGTIGNRNSHERGQQNQKRSRKRGGQRDRKGENIEEHSNVNRGRNSEKPRGCQETDSQVRGRGRGGRSGGRGRGIGRDIASGEGTNRGAKMQSNFQNGDHFATYPHNNNTKEYEEQRNKSKGQKRGKTKNSTHNPSNNGVTINQRNGDDHLNSGHNNVGGRGRGRGRDVGISRGGGSDRGRGWDSNSSRGRGRGGGQYERDETGGRGGGQYGRYETGGRGGRRGSQRGRGNRGRRGGR